MIDFNKTLQLFINGKEYDFSNNISFNFHPTNFSSITFNDVIAKEDNVFPFYLKNPKKIHREFTFAEVKQNGETIYFGVINDTGRLSLFPNSVKTFSVVITDFRKWLSLTNPINKLYRNKTPSEIVNDVVEILNEERIDVGVLNFTNNEPISAYSSINKNAYQILKNVISKQANSFLYFTIENNKILINYKSEEDMKVISKIKLDVNDKQFLSFYKIEDIVFENETYDYANFLTYTSENIISSFPIVEYDLTINANIYLKSNPIIIDTEISKTFLKNKEGETRRAIFINEKKYIAGQIYDFLYNPDNNVLKANENLIDSGEVLTITYYTKGKVSFQDKNSEEIEEISQISKTNGIVAKYDKFNDLSYANDLLRLLRTDLELFSTPNKKLIITSGEPIWELTEAVEVNVGIENLNGIYLVHEVSGENKVFGNGAIKQYTYTLKQTKNFDNIVNKFDNQSYRDEAIYNDEAFVEDIITFFRNIDLFAKNTYIGQGNILPADSKLNKKLNFSWVSSKGDKPKFSLYTIKGRE